MLTMRLVGDQETNDGTITITADRGALAELQELQAELAARSNIRDDGSVIQRVEVPPVVG